MADKPKVIRDTDAEAIRLAKTLIRTARFGALAVIDPATGSPFVSRVGVATDMDGTPVIFVSTLARHTKALIADKRCSLLLGEPGKGDALAHPRISLTCQARQLTREQEAHTRQRFLRKNPKAALYAELGDFWFFRLEMSGADLNGGFGRAYQLTVADISTPVLRGLCEMEQSAVEHMNADHADAIQLYAGHFAGLKPATWRISGIDADGIDLAAADLTGRVFFPTTLESSDRLRPVLVEMAKAARGTN